MSLFEHLRLLWGLRVSLARGALRQRAAAFSSLAGTLITIALTIAAARGTNTLFSSEAVRNGGDLRLLLALLLGFLASTLWITWPVVTASIDDAAELSRFALFPVQPSRLFLASMLAGLVEPRTLPVWGALLGAAHGLAPDHPLLGFATTTLLAIFCVAWGRLGLNLLLNLFRQRRSAEAMGGGLIVFLFCSAFVPPPNLSWLRNLNSAAPSIDDKFLRGSIATFSMLPTGGWTWAIMLVPLHRWSGALIAFTYLGVGAAIGYALAFFFLLRFHHGSGRSLPAKDVVIKPRDGFGGGSIDSVLVEREWRDLLLNSRARFTVALPFFLTILIKLVGARALAMELIGGRADAWLVGGISSYAALVLGAGFAQNSFGYDGNGAQMLLAAPVDPARILRAKNIVHAGLAIALGWVLIAFYAVYVAAPPAWVMLCAACNVTWQALLFAAAGNLFSVAAPRKFHPSLKRKDRVSPLVTALGFVAAGIAVAPGAQILKYGSPAEFLLLPLAGLLLWRLSIPLAMDLLATRRPQLLKAVARE